jgi:hypothetical protein
MKQSSQLIKLYYKTLWEKATCFGHLIDHHQACIQEAVNEQLQPLRSQEAIAVFRSYVQIVWYKVVV